MVGVRVLLVIDETSGTGNWGARLPSAPQFICHIQVFKTPNCCALGLLILDLCYRVLRGCGGLPLFLSAFGGRSHRCNTTNDLMYKFCRKIVCLLSSCFFWAPVVVFRNRLGPPAGVTQEEGEHMKFSFFLHLVSAACLS
ncbi:unnamed protein product [Pylaiella littoralis]